MIVSLSIRNIALIDQIQISFHRGMHVLSGETGAGKSIVVDAVNLVLGGRADKSLIRYGEKTASVEAVFDVPGNSRIKSIFERESIEFDGRTVYIYREISSEGRNLCRICGVLVPLNLLKEISLSLMDIHGQHEHQFLADPQKHREFLDNLGDNAFRLAQKDVEERYSRFLECHRKLIKLRKEEKEKENRLYRLEKDLGELRRIELMPGERESLESECNRMRNALKIRNEITQALSCFTREETNGSLECFRQALVYLRNASSMETEMKNFQEKFENLYYETEEAVYELESLAGRYFDDPDEIEKKEEKLDLIRRMEKKYNADIETVLAQRKEMENEYEHLNTLSDRIEEVSREHKKLLSEYRSSAKTLTGIRKRLSEKFEERIKEELKSLGMGNTEFKVDFKKPADDKPQMPRSTGDDDLEFMISPNPGEPLKPLAKIASGGELSRIMLAIKSMEAENTGIDCMVFDEIDTGISGRMAQAVSEKMIGIARNRQVICVTHLPQIAAGADFQYLVSKNVKEQKSFTNVTELTREERINDIARMISGAGGNNTEALIYARNMLESCEKIKDC